MEIDALTHQVIGCAYEVHNTLGAGFLEKVYENSLKFELETNGHFVKQQYPIPVYYKSQLVGDYIADLLVNDKLVVEIKAIENLNKIHEVQLVNYLNGIQLENGLLINFGNSVKIKRKFRDTKINPVNPV